MKKSVALHRFRSDTNTNTRYKKLCRVFVMWQLEINRKQEMSHLWFPERHEQLPVNELTDIVFNQTFLSR